MRSERRRCKRSAVEGRMAGLGWAPMDQDGRHLRRRRFALVALASLFEELLLIVRIGLDVKVRRRILRLFMLGLVKEAVKRTLVIFPVQPVAFNRLALPLRRDRMGVLVFHLAFGHERVFGLLMDVEVFRRVGRLVADLNLSRNAPIDISHIALFGRPGEIGNVELADDLARRIDRLLNLWPFEYLVDLITLAWLVEQ